MEASSEQIDKRDFSYVDPAFGITSKLSINAELQKQKNKLDQSNRDVKTLEK